MITWLKKIFKFSKPIVIEDEHKNWKLELKPNPNLSIKIESTAQGGGGGSGRLLKKENKNDH